MSKKFFVALPILAIFAIPVSAQEHKDWLPMLTCKKWTQRLQAWPTPR